MIIYIKEKKIMLILTRTTGTTIILGEKITITILKIKNNQVKIGIDAPKTILIYREEIYKKLKIFNLNKISFQATKIYYQKL